jgi:UDP-glucose 4-epimerase
VRVVVTGGAGFIGRNFAHHARTGGAAALRVVDDFSAGTGEDLEVLGPPAILDPGQPEWPWDPVPGRVQLLCADARDLGLVERACRGADAVVHLAAAAGIVESLADPLEHADRHVRTTVTVLEACRRAGVRRCVLASSGAAVGEHAPPLHEDLPPRPLSPYGAGKAAAEAFGHAYRAAFGLDVVALRFSNVYGPHSRHKSSVVARFIAAILAGRPVEVYGDGRQTRDFLFVGDLAAAIWAALGAPAPAPVYQIASGVETPVSAVLARLAALAEQRLGRPPVVVHRPARPGDVARSSADIRRARRDLGWAPLTGLDHGLALTFDWFLARAGRSGAEARR